MKDPPSQVIKNRHAERESISHAGAFANQSDNHQSIKALTLSLLRAEDLAYHRWKCGKMKNPANLGLSALVWRGRNREEAG
jgi:hypothetical protein